MSKYRWYEVWADEGLSPPYHLILLGGDDSFDVFNPAEKRFCYHASTYEGARIWLLENEYTQVDGRIGVL